MSNSNAVPSKGTGDERTGRTQFVVSRELALAAVTVFTIIVFWALYPTSFANFRNFSAIVRNLAFEGILAIGMMIMLIGGSFDLSVGSMASMIGVITA